jgi:two-component system, chemotaxis family, protein-glutamate methylesterase/glutaminase
LAAPKRDIVVIGASSGEVEALMRLIGDLPAALFVVVHFPQGASSALARILDRAGPSRAVSPEDGEEILPGRVCVPRPNHHVLMEDGRVRPTRGPKENRRRPAVDALFRAAAVAHGARAVGVVLTGARDGGAAGRQAPRRRRSWRAWSTKTSRSKREERIPRAGRHGAQVEGLDPAAINGDERPGKLSRFTCPDCTGPCTRSMTGS